MAIKRRKKSKNYFTQETEDYIVVYNGLDPNKDEKKRSTYDWIGRLQDGETLTPENMFEDK